MTTKTNNTIEQINSDIKTKMDELFDLLLQNTLKSNEINLDLVKSVNGPACLIEDLEQNKPTQFISRMGEIKEVLKRELFERYESEMWMDHMDSKPTIATKIDGYDGWNLPKIN
jgi:hypothetical protein